MYVYPRAMHVYKICISVLCMYTYVFPLLVSILDSTVYSAASSVNNSVRGFKEYFDFHKSSYDNVSELYIRTYVCI